MKGMVTDSVTFMNGRNCVTYEFPISSVDDGIKSKSNQMIPSNWMEQFFEFSEDKKEASEQKASIYWMLQSLAHANDNGSIFLEIADWIEENL